MKLAEEILKLAESTSISGRIKEISKDILKELKKDGVVFKNQKKDIKKAIKYADLAAKYVDDKLLRQANLNKMDAITHVYFIRDLDQHR